MTTASPFANYLDEMRACAESINLKPREFVQPTDHHVKLNGIDFHYVDWGNAHLPPLVLLHGGALTAHTWDMSALLLRDRYHVIAPDQRGHGDTGWTPESQAGEDNGDLMLRDTEAFIEHLGVTQVVLCGMSMGGQNAIRYTARHPERVSRLIIVDIAPVTMQEGQIEMEAFRVETETMSRFEDFLERAIKFNPQRKPAHLKYSLMHSLKPTADGWTWKQQHREATAQPDEAAMKAAAQKRSEALWADVRVIKTPTLLMRGSISKILAPEVAAEVVKTMKDAELVVIEGAGHSVQGDQPAAFAQAAMAWLERRA